MTFIQYCNSTYFILSIFSFCDPKIISNKLCSEVVEKDRKGKPSFSKSSTSNMRTMTFHIRP